MAKTCGGLTRAMPCNSLGAKQIFTTVAEIKIRKVNGRYQYQPPSLKFSCTRVLDMKFPHPCDSKLYFNVQACLDNLVDKVERRVNWEMLEGSFFRSSVLKLNSNKLIGR